LSFHRQYCCWPRTGALAQSSGNFAAALTTQQCKMSSSNGALTGGTSNHLLTTTVQTPNSSQTTLLITPSFVTGLYGNTYITSTQSTASQSAAVVVSVLLDGKPVLPETTADRRRRTIPLPADQHADVDADRRVQNNNNCDSGMVLSTLSAHSAQFVAPNVGQGVHKLDVTWAMECDDGSGSPSGVEVLDHLHDNSAAACVGPGTVQVQQVKAFSQSGGISVQ